MTSEVLDFLAEVKKKIGQPDRVLEVGSLNINGSARSVFQEADTEYIGIDQIEGRDVDIVDNAYDLEMIFPTKDFWFDLVICCETLEHDPYFWITIEQMKKVLKPGGWLIITTPGIKLQKHDYPEDYYRFFGETYKTVFFADMIKVEVKEFYFKNNAWKDLKPDWVFGYGKKL